MATRCIYSAAVCFLCTLTNFVSGKETGFPKSLTEAKALWIETTTSLFHGNGLAVELCAFVVEWPVITAVCATAIALLLYYGYQLFFIPLNRVRRLEDVGYAHDPSMGKRDIANMVRRRRAVGNIPPVYPNGWFGLMESFDLAKGQVKEVNALGVHLAVFRDEEGKAHVVNAYCPHLGANLAVGGKVVGNCIECPFHAWRFRGEDGKCTNIPAAEKVPDIARVKSWKVRELNGWVYVWYHAEGDEPYWFPPEIEEITKGEWTYRGRTEHIVNAQIQEIPENGADVAHLPQVHGPFMGAGTDLRYMWAKMWTFVEHRWNASWEAFQPPEGHIAQMSVGHKLWLCGMHMSMLDMDVKAKQIGPAFVYLSMDCGIFGKGVIIHNLLPVGPITQKLIHNIYVQSRMPTFAAKFYMMAEAIQVERDIMIWNNKRYENKPIFARSKEDSTIAKHRRWYSQFYSEHSPRLSFQEDSLSW
ncbi:cholesterol 7-desaturase nvd-like [Haliotis asinina]|uniref:cholesterol 7-desaturase nvd-like n=1 Tax=Haliotis asinina TaxID=109174 RepID=UPI00353244D3